MRDLRDLLLAAFIVVVAVAAIVGFLA